MGYSFGSIWGQITKKSPEKPVYMGFSREAASFKLGVSFAVLNYICLSFMQIHASFYFNYIIYSGLLIFCCQNVATKKSSNLQLSKKFMPYVPTVSDTTSHLSVSRFPSTVQYILLHLLSSTSLHQMPVSASQWYR